MRMEMLPMKNKIIYLCPIIFICLLLTGCRKESVEQQGNVSDNIATAAADVTEDTTENVTDIENTALSDEDVTVISVLGKEELVIENSRIHDEVHGGAYRLNNLFTLDETNIILNTIKGTWEVDEYAGFVTYTTYYDYDESGVDGKTFEEYQEDEERAATNIPDFTISIKQRFGAYGIDDIDENYIFVNGYSSPLSIILSPSIREDEYPVFRNQTLIGYDYKTEDSYPVIYIQFFYPDYEENEIIYKSATLALTSDGQFLLLKDGGFYTLKKNVQSEIMTGNFEYLSNSDEYLDSIEELYRKGEEDEHFSQWWRTDLNGDGIKDLILEDCYSVYSGFGYGSMIYGIFICGEDEATCIWWDDDDDTEYYVFGKSTDELMYTELNYEGAVSYEQYSHCNIDEEGNLITDYTLTVYRIDGTVDEKEAEEWRQAHPDMAEDGIYYRKYTKAGAEILTQEELENIYETVTGYNFHSEFY